MQIHFRAGVLASALATALIGVPLHAQLRTAHCPVEPAGVTLGYDGTDPGGMINDGWDGEGQNPVVLTFHVEGATPDMGSEQRAAQLSAMLAWSKVADVTFVELPLANANRSIDFGFYTGDHAWAEPQESSPACPFDGPGNVAAHAGFPPGAASQCVTPMAETWAGNVHFDEDDDWEAGDSPGMDGLLDLELFAVHEIGHALGLKHSSFPADVMFPSATSEQQFAALSANDVANLLSGYAAGQGIVYTLEFLGVWVDHAAAGAQLGTQDEPFDTVAEGIAGIPPLNGGVPLRIHAGTYDESALLFDRPVLLETVGGTVVIR